MSGCEDVAVRVGGADDQIYFTEAVFYFIEADKLDVILPFIFELEAGYDDSTRSFFCRNGGSLP